MIDRYQTEDMKKIWSDVNKFKTWLKVELAATEVLNNRGIVPDESFEIIKDKANFDKDRILKIEKTTRHDVIAFLTNVAEYVGPDSRYIHMGMTSSDLLDTSLALLCKEAGEIILRRLNSFHLLLRKKAVQWLKENEKRPMDNGKLGERTILKDVLLYQVIKFKSQMDPYI